MIESTIHNVIKNQINGCVCVIRNVTHYRLLDGTPSVRYVLEWDPKMNPGKRMPFDPLTLYWYKNDFKIAPPAAVIKRQGLPDF